MEEKRKFKYYRQKILAFTLAGVILVTGGRFFRSNKVDEESSPNLTGIETLSESPDSLVGISKTHEPEKEAEENILSNVPEELKDDIMNYETVMSEYDKEFDKEEFKDIVSKITFVDCSIESDNFDPNATISYDVETNTFYYDKLLPAEEYFNHEMNHAVFDNKESSDGEFAKIDGNEMYGQFLCEGLSAFFTKELFNHSTYDINQQYIKCLSYILGTDNLYQIYKHGDIYDLERALGNISTPEVSVSLISDLDMLHKTLYNYEINDNSNELLPRIQKSLIDHYFLSLQDGSIDIRRAVEFKSMLFSRIDLFVSDMVDSHSEEYFNSKMKEYLNDEELYSEYLNTSISQNENKSYLGVEGNIEDTNERMVSYG